MQLDLSFVETDALLEEIKKRTDLGFCATLQAGIKCDTDFCRRLFWGNPYSVLGLLRHFEHTLSHAIECSEQGPESLPDVEMGN